MKLSAELFCELSRSLATDVPSGMQCDNRREARLGLIGRAVIIPCLPRSGRQPASVGVRDLSASGVGIVHSQRLEPGEQFILRVPSPQAGILPRAVLCVVTHCRELGPGFHSIGALFARFLDPKSTSASVEAPAPHERVSLPVGTLGEAFRFSAADGLNPEEHEQLRQVEQRLSALRLN